MNKLQVGHAFSSRRGRRGGCAEGSKSESESGWLFRNSNHWQLDDDPPSQAIRHRRGSGAEGPAAPSQAGLGLDDDPPTRRKANRDGRALGWYTAARCASEYILSRIFVESQSSRSLGPLSRPAKSESFVN